MIEGTHRASVWVIADENDPRAPHWVDTDTPTPRLFVPTLDPDDDDYSLTTSTTTITSPSTSISEKSINNNNNNATVKTEFEPVPPGQEIPFTDMGMKYLRITSDFNFFFVEVQNLIEGVRKYGTGRWHRILKDFEFHPQRTTDDLKVTCCLYIISN